MPPINQKSMAPAIGQQQPSAIPKPRVTALTILAIGGISFALATVWPPLLLVVTAFLSFSLPYAFRVNDDGESRRRLWREFEKREDLPEELKCEDVDLEELYWVNER